MSEKREVVVIGGGGSYGRNLSKLIANALIGSHFSVAGLETSKAEIRGSRYDKVIFDEFYSFEREVPVYIDYDQPKSQKPWKAGYIPQHGAGPSYYPSSLLLNLVDRVK